MHHHSSQIIATRFRHGELWLYYERFAEQDQIFHNPTSTSQGRVAIFSNASPASRDICESRLDLAGAYVSGTIGTGWRVQVIGGPPGSPYVREYGRVVRLDGADLAEIRFEQHGLEDAVIPLVDLAVVQNALPWPAARASAGV